VSSNTDTGREAVQAGCGTGNALDLATGPSLQPHSAAVDQPWRSRRKPARFLDTLVDLAITQPRSTTHQVVIPPPGLLVPTTGLAPVAPQCPAMPVPPRPWLLTTISRPSDRRGIRIFTPSVWYYHKRSDPRHRWR